MDDENVLSEEAASMPINVGVLAVFICGVGKVIGSVTRNGGLYF